jgi:hypothetical protein
MERERPAAGFSLDGRNESLWILLILPGKQQLMLCGTGLNKFLNQANWFRNL